ncbi:hypothetical protein AJ79_00433 [Helicocarpus griseus UAMH5409]|uniref:Uncharacterized protein n=1 Tax=Helicocarpus griseus UAMH5409 TaxID=1447875 RepID=A0A2B7YCQ0_9EURO|nr:hypothetical protein AJ79_00433 [Helicocarpus griseus UAMH5409]
MHFLFTASALLSFLTFAFGQKRPVPPGIVLVLAPPSEDINRATLEDVVGCLNVEGRLIPDQPRSACARFNFDPDTGDKWYTDLGNCTFEHPSQEPSVHKRGDRAFYCAKDLQPEVPWQTSFHILEEWRKQPDMWLLMIGAYYCYFYGMSLPNKDEAIPIWPYRYNSGPIEERIPGATNYVLVYQHTG